MAIAAAASVAAANTVAANTTKPTPDHNIRTAALIGSRLFLPPAQLLPNARQPNHYHRIPPQPNHSLTTPTQNGPGDHPGPCTLTAPTFYLAALVAVAFFTTAVAVAFGLQKSASSLVQLSGNRLMLGVNTNRFDSVLL